MQAFNKDIKEILERSSFYPSGDNCQPFRFKINSENSSVQIFHVDKIAKHSLNYKNIASLISFGALLENIEIAATNFGYRVEEFLDIDGGEGNLNCFGTLKFEKDETIYTHELFEFIAKRVTDRRKYSGEDVDEKKLMVTSSFKSAKYKILSTKKNDLVDLLARSDALLWKWEEASYDILNWIRFTKLAKERSKNGFCWRNLGVDIVTSWILRLMKESRLVYKLMVYTIFPIVVKIITTINLKSSSKLVVITTKDFTNGTLVASGRLMQRIWLNLTKNSFSAQPIMSLTLGAYTKARYNEINYPKSYSKNIDKGVKIIKDLIKNDETPLVILRVGKAKIFPANMKTLRKNIEDLII